MDGAYFGSTFAHLLLMQYPALRPSPPRPSPKYVPRVFGFKIRLPNSNSNSSSSNNSKKSSPAKLKDSNDREKASSGMHVAGSTQGGRQSGDVRMAVVGAPSAASNNRHMLGQ